MKKKVKKAIKVLLKGMFAFVIAVVMFFLLTWILGKVIVNKDFEEPMDGVPLYLWSSGVHVDLAFDYADANIDWGQYIDFDAFKTPQDEIRILSFGWGDRSFFLETPTWEDLTVYNVFKALFLPSQSAMHLTLYKSVYKENDKKKQLMISKQQLKVIEEFILNQILKDASGAIGIDHSGYNNIDDRFYEAHGKYSLLKTCNNWANQAMKKAGIKTAFWAPIDHSILQHY